MNPSNGNAYLYAAYIVVWAVHSLYAYSLLGRARRLRREAAELESQRQR